MMECHILAEWVRIHKKRKERDLVMLPLLKKKKILKNCPDLWSPFPLYHPSKPTAFTPLIMLLVTNDLHVAKSTDQFLIFILSSCQPYLTELTILLEMLSTFGFPNTTLYGFSPTLLATPLLCVLYQSLPSLGSVWWIAAVFSPWTYPPSIFFT